LLCDQAQAADLTEIMIELLGRGFATVAAAMLSIETELMRCAIGSLVVPCIDYFQF
jgi:hypothetical protein